MRDYYDDDDHDYSDSHDNYAYGHSNHDYTVVYDEDDHASAQYYHDYDDHNTGSLDLGHGFDHGFAHDFRRSLNPFLLQTLGTSSFDLTSVCEAQGGTCTEPIRCQQNDGVHNSEVDLRFHCTSTTTCCLDYRIVTIKKVIQQRNKRKPHRGQRLKGQFSRDQGHRRSRGQVRRNQGQRRDGHVRKINYGHPQPSRAMGFVPQPGTGHGQHSRYEQGVSASPSYHHHGNVISNGHNRDGYAVLTQKYYGGSGNVATGISLG